MEYDFNWAFLFSYLESFRTSLQNRCLTTEHAVSVEALTWNAFVHFRTIVFNAVFLC